MGSNDLVAPFDGLHFSADAFERLEQLAGLRDYIDWLIEQAIRECRHNAVERGVDVVGQETRETALPKPLSWARIGGVLGISRHPARKRYKHLD